MLHFQTIVEKSLSQVHATSTILALAANFLITQSDDALQNTNKQLDAIHKGCCIVLVISRYAVYKKSM